ncbi:MAG: hypothetical protein IKJ28_03450 [Alphaproteobacteria bacterium]|nr:hypothetical protein [Alphaproteobacteria bacterium]
MAAGSNPAIPTNKKQGHPKGMPLFFICVGRELNPRGSGFERRSKARRENCRFHILYEIEEVNVLKGQPEGGAKRINPAIPTNKKQGHPKGMPLFFYMCRSGVEPVRERVRTPFKGKNGPLIFRLKLNKLMSYKDNPKDN